VSLNAAAAAFSIAVNALSAQWIQNMLETNTSKALLRKQYLEKRCAMSCRDWTRASEAIRLRLEQSRLYHDCKALLTYVSAKDNEVNTCMIIDASLQNGLVVVVPVVVSGEKELRWAQIQSRKELVRGRFGLLEPDPTRTNFVDVPANALCLTPGIAFTPEGWRIGYGGGYYDRFLEKFSGISLGLAFEIQMTSTLPRDAYDRRVHYVLTEKECYVAAPE